MAINDLQAFQDIKYVIHNTFQIKNLENLKYFLKIEVTRSSKGISLRQKWHYALEMHANYGFLCYKPTKVPMNSNLRLSKIYSNLLTDPRIFQRMICRLFYLTITRLDLNYYM